MSLCIVLGYLGWVAAQVSALGLVFHVVTDGAMSQQAGMMLGASLTLLYTMWGGLVSVAYTDLVQSVVIVLGLVIVCVIVAARAGGLGEVLSSAADADKFRFLPTHGADVLWFVSDAITMGLGSLPSQDVYQRAMSARDVRSARLGCVIGGFAYLAVAAVPLTLGYVSGGSDVLIAYGPRVGHMYIPIRQVRSDDH